MKELNEITRTRIRVLAVILGVIVLVHVIVILCIMLPHRAAAPGPAPAPQTAQTAASPAVSVPAGVPAVPAVSASRYRKPLGTAWFGKPFNYRTAVRGALPKMPGGNAAGTGIQIGRASCRERVSVVV